MFCRQLTTIVDGNGAPSTKSLDEPVATGVASGSGSGSAWPPGLMVFKTGGPVDIHTALLGSGSGSGSFQFDEGPWSECSAECSLSNAGVDASHCGLLGRLQP